MNKKELLDGLRRLDQYKDFAERLTLCDTSEALELLSKLEELLFKKRQKKHQVKKCRPEVGLNSGRLQVKQTLILAKPLSARELIMNDLKKRGYDTSKVEIVTCGNKNENS